MHLRVLGKTNDEKGAELEALARAVFRRLGYRSVVTNRIGSGGQEIDLTAEFAIPALEHGVRVICECKAHAAPVGMADWQRFLGKLYCDDALRGSESHGCFVALTGVNGNVQGSFEALLRAGRPVSIITDQRLVDLVSAEFGLVGPQDVASYIASATARVVVEIQLAYSQGSCYWLVVFADGAFTVLPGNGVGREVPAIAIELAAASLGGGPHLDLKQEAETRRVARMARQVAAVAALLDGGAITPETIRSRWMALDGSTPLEHWVIAEAVAWLTAFIHESASGALRSGLGRRLALPMLARLAV